MRPIEFTGCNTTFGKADALSDEQCAPLSAEVGQDANGVAYALTAWMPSYEDLQAFNAGRPLYLQVAAGGRMVPVSLFTTDEHRQPNVVE